MAKYYDDNFTTSFYNIVLRIVKFLSTNKQFLTSNVYINGHLYLHS